MSKLAKTILQIEVDDKEFQLRYNGPVEFNREDPDFKKKAKHDHRIMKMLLQNDAVFKLFARLYEPVKRFRQREARRKTSVPSVH